MFLATATEYTLLDQIQWFGSDGFVQNEELLSDTLARSFAASVNYTSGIYAVPDNAMNAAFSSRYQALTGKAPTTYAMASYDAMRLAIDAKVNAGPDATADEIATALVTLASSSAWLTGNLVLDENGDRALGDYYFWSVQESGGAYSWVHTMTYANGIVTDE